MQNPEVFDLEFHLDEKSGVLKISLNELALDSLIRQLSILRERRAGAHFHLDEESGLSGNIKEVILQRRDS